MALGVWEFEVGEKKAVGFLQKKFGTGQEAHESGSVNIERGPIVSLALWPRERQEKKSNNSIV